ncbi:hypothetical protein [Microbacterium algeriense]|uniref:hypothetical protein n=2 Tax=Microbacterium TaxID=33882 RepID=UPI003D76666E
MTNATVSAITDTPQCPVYRWCELDHTDPDIIELAANTHEKHMTIAAGDVSETFLLEVVNGRPRIECVFDGGEIWIEPGEATNTFENIAEVFTQAAAEYERFTKALSTRLTRPHSVTAELADRDV